MADAGPFWIESAVRASKCCHTACCSQWWCCRRFSAYDPLFLRVDYGLPGHVCLLFPFSGNLGRIPAVRELLTGLLGSNTAMTAGLASQVIS